MAILRQKGSPSLFLTLSCAEYSWDGLLKEILETISGRKVTEKEIEDLTINKEIKLSPKMKFNQHSIFKRE